MDTRGYYAVIPANVRYSKIPNGAKLLYGEITALCNEKGFCWASNSYFETLYGVDRSTIIRWLNSLEKNGFIKREIVYKEGTKEIDKRVITIEVVAKMTLGSGKNATGGGGKNDTTPSGKNATENNTYINNTRVSEDTLANKELICESERAPHEDLEFIQSLKEHVEDNHVKEIVDGYKRICTDLPQIQRASEARVKKVKARLKVYPVEDILKAFEMANYSKFLKGKTGNWNGATFDWFFDNDENIQKVLEGQYKDKPISKEPKKLKFNEFEQRNYDYDALEKKLTGSG